MFYQSRCLSEFNQYKNFLSEHCLIFCGYNRFTACRTVLPILDKNYSTCTNLSITERFHCIHIPVVYIEICCAHASPAELVKKYIMVQKSISLLVKWVLAQAHEQASTAVMTIRCIMESWNKYNPLTEHYFEETTRLLTCVSLS